jgi:arsenate reductase
VTVETDSLHLMSQKVLFACLHNAGRSQMAAAILNALADSRKVEAISAGTRPGPAIHAEVRQAMLEIGIDVSSARPRLLTEDLARQANLLVTMGCGDECPLLPGVERDDWVLPDPKGRSIEEVRAIRDEIRTRVAALIESRGWGK